MERIQTALNKARNTRNGRSSDKRPDRKRVQQLVGDVDAAWAELNTLNPKPGHMKRNRVESYEGGHAAAHFDLMRTKVLQQMRANNWRRLAITSPGSACGKTTTCANLAFSLARQKDTRTVVAEMDLRRPALAKLLGLGHTSCQFSRALDGREEIKDHMLRYGDNLAFAVNRHSAKNPSELLQSNVITDTLNEIEKQFDPTLVIFDMPPMLVTDDVLGFLDQVDCVLLVAAAESTTVDEIDSCERELAEHTNMLGVVLNKCRYMEKGYGYSYYE
jgi:capsular exopolysaccharide synthesis family protein